MVVESAAAGSPIPLRAVVAGYRVARNQRGGRRRETAGGRESTSSFSHANEFCGKWKVAPEPVVAWDGLEGGRRIREKESAGRGSWSRCRVGKNEIVVKRRGFPGCPFAGRA